MPTPAFWRSAFAALCLTMTLPAVSGAALAASPTVAHLGDVGAVHPERLDKQAFVALVQARFGASARVSWSDLYQRPTALRRLQLPANDGATAPVTAQAFVSQHADLLGVSATDLPMGEITHTDRGVVVAFSQRHQGVPVEGRGVTIRLDAKGAIRGVRLNLLPVAGIAEGASARAPIFAQRAAAQAFGLDLTSAVGTPTLVILAHPHAPSSRLAWRVPVAYIPMTAHFTVWVDAVTGEILQQAPATVHQPLTHMPLSRQTMEVTP